MRPLALFGDSVTTDHISPAGAFKASLTCRTVSYSLLGVREEDFNSYGSRRGNHHVMMRGTFANVRIRNKMADGKEGGYTKLMPEGKLMTIFDACQEYKKGIPLIVFAGRDYGMGSSRDWAAKGPALLGVKVVVAQSFERIHRSNLIGMGILPLQFLNNDSIDSLGIKGDETFSLLGMEEKLTPQQEITLEIHRSNRVERIKLLSRLDTPLEVEYYEHGGILQFVLRQLLSS